MILNNILKQAGLTDAEIAVYMAGLEIGPNTASTIAKTSGLKRGHTYNVLESLRQKGIATEFVKNGIKRFAMCAPRNLLSLLDTRIQEIELQKKAFTKIIPDLERIQNPGIKQAKVRFFEGKEGIKEIYEDTLRESKPIYGFVDFDYIFPEGKDRTLYDWIWDYASRRADKNIWYLGLCPKSGKSDLAYKRRKRQKRKMKVLPKGTYLPVEINIYGNKVAIMSTYKDMVGLIIEDPVITETLRNIHQAFFKKLPDYK